MLDVPNIHDHISYVKANATFEVHGLVYINRLPQTKVLAFDYIYVQIILITCCFN